MLTPSRVEQTQQARPVRKQEQPVKVIRHPTIKLRVQDAQHIIKQQGVPQQEVPQPTEAQHQTLTSHPIIRPIAHLHNHPDRVTIVQHLPIRHLAATVVLTHREAHREVTTEARLAVHPEAHPMEVAAAHQVAVAVLAVAVVAAAEEAEDVQHANRHHQTQPWL